METVKEEVDQNAVNHTIYVIISQMAKSGKFGANTVNLKGLASVLENQISPKERCKCCNREI